MRRKAAVKRKIWSDPKYNSYLVARLINMLMKEGKKSIAEKMIYSAFDTVAEKLRGEIMEIFDKALQNITPHAEVMSRRIGGATYQVPIPVSQERGATLAMRWLRDSALKRSEHGMANRLANEIIDAYNGRGGAVKMREDNSKSVEANRAFAHYNTNYSSGRG